MNLILLTLDQPGFEPRSLGPKVATLPFCYASLTVLSLFIVEILAAKKIKKKLINSEQTNLNLVKE